MERKLKNLFDFQRFEGNSSLQAVINDVHARYALAELSDDELTMVNAAGVQAMQSSYRNVIKPEDK